MLVYFSKQVWLPNSVFSVHKSAFTSVQLFYVELAGCFRLLWNKLIIFISYGI